METIDAAFSQFEGLIAQVKDYDATMVSEEDTRLKVIDRILTEVLGWPYSEISTEDYSLGSYIDYKLAIGGLARLIVEAKRDRSNLGVSDRACGKPYKLNGPVLQSPTVREGITQAVRYCGQKNAELACVTNGREWVIFRGSRLGDGHDTLDGMAFVFPDLSSIRTGFRMFYDLLSYEKVRENRFRAFFQEAEGQPIRSHAFKQALRSDVSAKMLPVDPLTRDLERVMTSFFRRLSGDNDPGLLAKCFVVTKESQEADDKLLRISEEMAKRIRQLDTDTGSELTEVIDRVLQMQRNDFVVIVGTKGAGKSTFIDRFFSLVLRKDLASRCLILKVDLSDSDGDLSSLTEWLNRHLLDTAESALFPTGYPSFEEVQGVFFDEYRRMSTGTLRVLYETDKPGFKIEFGKHIERRREERPHEYIKKLIGHAAHGRQLIPCIVFDNADHFEIEFQEKVFQYAHSIYQNQICLVILPITDKTSWQLTRQGALQSFECESLFLPTPSSKKVIERRISYLVETLSSERKERGRGYFLKRGIGLSLENLTAFTSCLQCVFLETGSVAHWIGNLANRDIRQCLEIARDVMISPHLRTEELLNAYIAGSTLAIPPIRILKALIRGHFDIYRNGQNKFVRNVYCLDDRYETTPLLALSILQVLRDARFSKAGEGYVEVDQICQYFQAMGVPIEITATWLSAMLSSGLCFSFDPTVKDIEEAKRIEISPSGTQHFLWATKEKAYMEAMSQITPILNRDVFSDLENADLEEFRLKWAHMVRLFVKYLLDEDAQYCQVPDHSAYLGQRRLRQGLAVFRGELY